MRGSLGLFKNANGLSGAIGIGNHTKSVLCSFSTSSDGGGSGRGRGRGGLGPSSFGFVAGHPGEADSGEEIDKSDKSAPPSGIGHGRGKPLSSSSYRPLFNTFVASNQPSRQSSLGRGRGGPTQQPPESLNEQDLKPMKPIFLTKDEETGASTVANSVIGAPRQPIGEKDLPPNILSVMSGYGRGKPARLPLSDVGAKEENRHLRPRQSTSVFNVGAKEENQHLQPRQASGSFNDDDAEIGREHERVDSRETGRTSRTPKLSREDAVKKAVNVLSRPGKDQVEGGRERGFGRGGGRGRGRGQGKEFAGRWRGRRLRSEREEEEDQEEVDEEKALYVGDDADGEKFAKFIGPEKMNELTEAFEDMSSYVLPDLEEDEYIEALDTNLKIELEPEYLLGDFETNPDIDEKPPMSLREALDKMKPFLMAYEGIQNQEEWEEVVKDAMERVPLLKEIVDHYSGPDRVTAKQQQGELERVAKTLPASAPDSVKRFTNRAVLSLQSNPGWGFDRKCQFMDKLVLEVSKSCK